jgi:hypothetical protein
MLYVKHVTAEGRGGAYVEVEGVDLEQSTFKFTERWQREFAPSLELARVQLLLVPDGAEEPDSAHEAGAVPLSGRGSLFAAGVRAGSSLLAICGTGAPARTPSFCLS